MHSAYVSFQHLFLLRTGNPVGFAILFLGSVISGGLNLYNLVTKLQLGDRIPCEAAERMLLLDIIATLIR
jgi:hypothetical protein